MVHVPWICQLTRMQLFIITDIDTVSLWTWIRHMLGLSHGFPSMVGFLEPMMWMYCCDKNTTMNCDSETRSEQLHRKTLWFISFIPICKHIYIYHIYLQYINVIVNIYIYTHIRCVCICINTMQKIYIYIYVLCVYVYICMQTIMVCLISVFQIFSASP